MSSAETSAHDASEISRVLAQGYKRLRFPEVLEREFRAEHLTGSRRWVRMSLLVALATSAASAVVDPWVVHATVPLPTFIRYGVQAPMLLLILLATLDRFYERWYEAAILIGAPVF